MAASPNIKIAVEGWEQFAPGVKDIFEAIVKIFAPIIDALHLIADLGCYLLPEDDQGRAEIADCLTQYPDSPVAWCVPCVALAALFAGTTEEARQELSTVPHYAR